MIVQYFDRQLFQTVPLQFMKFIILTINGKISYSPALENVVSPIRGMFTQWFVILPSFLKDFHPMDTLAVFMLEMLKLSKTLKSSRDDFNVLVNFNVSSIKTAINGGPQWQKNLHMLPLLKVLLYWEILI